MVLPGSFSTQSSIIQQFSTFVNFRCKINSIRCRKPSPYEWVCRQLAHRSTTPNQEHSCHIVHLFITRSDSAALPDKNPFSPPKLEFFSNIGQLTIFSCNASVGWRQTWQTFCLLNQKSGRAPPLKPMLPGLMRRGDGVVSTTLGANLHSTKS